VPALRPPLDPDPLAIPRPRPPAPSAEKLEARGGPGWSVRSPGEDARPPAVDDTPLEEPTALRASATRGLSPRVCRIIITAVVAVATVLTGVVVFGWFGTPRHITRPTAIGNMTWLTAAPNDAQRALTDQGWTQVTGGVYGNDGKRHLTLLAGRPPRATADDDAFLDGFAAGLKQAGYAFDPAAASRLNNAGTAYSCGPATGAAGRLSLCVWSDGDVVGVVIDTVGASTLQTYSEALQARAAVERE